MNYILFTNNSYYCHCSCYCY